MLEKSVAFLNQLKENNYKEWFHENKPLYEDAKKEFENFVKILIHEVSAFDQEIGLPEPKDCIFRIFRDIRFTNDKTPYKTNFGAFLAKGGNRKSEYGGYYFHLEPGNSMLAGGIWLPQPDILKAVREEIYHNTEEFLALVNHPDFQKHFGDFDQDYLLKTSPKDYPKDWPYIGYLKHKSYTMSKPLADQIISGNRLTDEVITVFKAMSPVNNFFNGVIEDVRNK